MFERRRESVGEAGLAGVPSVLVQAHHVEELREGPEKETLLTFINNIIITVRVLNFHTRQRHTCGSLPEASPHTGSASGFF